MNAISDQDREHLRLLAVFHYVVGGLGALFACFPLIHLVMGVFVLAGVFPPGAFPPDGAEAAPRVVGLLLVFVALGFILVGWAVAGGILLAGRKLQRRTGYTYCFVVACVECLFFPFGTALGVFTLIVLSRPSVKEMFASAPEPPGMR